ncbi:MAG: hypothetical protein EDM05_57570 [Leptolyngbya sp. IPPAS B-1204]|nr:MAG: hypothetical protein EDM05_29385 [Leptolyngbya sp. IPPAS B-1204]
MKKLSALVTIGLRYLLMISVMLLLVFPPLLNSAAAADNHNPLDQRYPSEEHPIKDSTSSDLSDIPNLDQMDYDVFEEHIGDIPNDRKPLFNTDNPKLQIKDKTPGSDKTITTEDLQEP